MAYKSPLPQHLNRRNRDKTEPKIMLKKMRSIKLHKLCSLKQSDRQATSQLDWRSTDSSSNDSSSIRSSPDRISLSDGKEEESFQGESESAATAPFSLNQNRGINGGNERKISKSNKHACPACFRPFGRRPKSRLNNPPSIVLPNEVESEASPNSHSAGLKKQVQANPRNSDSSFLSSDHSRTSSHQSNSAASSQKSLQTLTKSSSTMRRVRKLQSKASFKSKTLPLKKNSKISQDLSLNRATCSSTLKDSKFPKQAEHYPSQSESEVISVKKVCPYNHCSLHGHSHAPEPPPKRFLYKRRLSMKKQNGVKPKSLSIDGMASSGDKKKAFQTSKMVSNVEPALAKNNYSTGSSIVKNDQGLDFTIKNIVKPRDESYRGARQENEDADVAGIMLGEKSHPAESANENLNQIQKFPAVEKDILEPVLTELKETSDCCCVETKQDESISETENVHLKGEEVIASNPGNGISIATFTGWIKDEPSTLIQVSSSDDSGEATKPNSEISLTSCHPLEELGASKEEKNGNPDPNDALISGSSLARECETNGFIPLKDDKASATIHEARKPRVKKNNHISMWHMIHQQMVLGLAEEAENQQFQPTDEEGRVNDANILPETNSFGLGPDISYSKMGTENHVPVSKELELRKIFAIKLVREAIEKILLPEVEDQSSDMISVTSEATSDEELPEKNQEKSEEQSIPTSEEAKHNLKETDNNELEDDKSVDAEKADQAENTTSVPEEENARKKSDKQTPKGWSNLRKIILLKRFVKELEKVKKFNPAKPQHLPLEPESEAEKVSLRPQMMGEKKSSEEWMLDYALRQVISQLAPTQKRKVALLVKAFETVVPPQESVSEASDTDQKIEDFAASNPVSYGKSDATDLSTPTLKGSQLRSNASLKSDNTVSYLHEKVPLDLNAQEVKGMISNLNSKSGGPESSDKLMELDKSSDVAGEPPCAVSSSATERNIEANAANIVLPTSDSDPLEKLLAGKEGSNKESGSEHLVQQEFPLLVASKPNSTANSEHKTQLDKQNIKMWHMIYQHVVSGIAAKVGTQLLDGADEEQVDDANMSPERKCSGSFHENMKTDHDDVGKENHDTNHQKIEFSKSIAVKLIQEAVDEILLPEIQDDSSDSQSVAIDILPDHELIEKHHGDCGESSILNSTDSAEDSFKESDKSKVEDGVSLYQEKETSPSCNISTEEDKRASSMVTNRLEQQKSKNWSKLKKLILLKRSIKALENIRKLNSQPPPQLPLTRVPEEEKIDLRRQMMDERKKAEQWMLDYAVQHIVTKLTPARKRRVAMLVEAFEAVVPLPEV